MLERWHKGGNFECKKVERSAKKITFGGCLLACLCSHSLVLAVVVAKRLFVEDEDTSVDETIEESTEVIDVTDSPPVDEADPDEVTSLDDETISDEEVVEEIPCTWDVGWKKVLRHGVQVGSSRTEDARLGSHSLSMTDLYWNSMLMILTLRTIT